MAQHTPVPSHPAHARAEVTQVNRNGSDFLLFCDEPADEDLFVLLKSLRPRLSTIPKPNVVVYPQGAAPVKLSTALKGILPLHQDDRPDWVFCYRGRPVLVVEMTQHAYTGDNGLQRFARFAAAAENGVPFVYFGPLSRVRDDELDGDRNASPRRLTSDLFEGMDKLAAIYGVPQLYVEWAVGGNGLPAKLPARPSNADIERLYGRLLDLVERLLFTAPAVPDGSPLADPEVFKAQENTRRLAGETNTRASDVKVPVGREEIIALLERPAQIVEMLGDSGYFDKGKPDKLVALHALQQARVTCVQLPNGRVVALDEEKRARLVEWITSLSKFSRKGVAYYTGYKWRSDPHCGVLVNIDYRLCRNEAGTDPKLRLNPLIVVYPRIALDASGPLWSELDNAAHDPRFADLFRRRYPLSEASAKLASVTRSEKLYALWGNKTKQSRLFRRYADLVITSDGVVLGDSLASEIPSWLSG